MSKQMSNDSLVSFFVQWGLGEVAPYYKHRKSYLFIVDQIDLSSALNDPRIDRATVVSQHVNRHPNIKIQIVPNLPPPVHLFDSVIVVTQHPISINDIQTWSKFLNDYERHSIVCIFPSSQCDYIKRLGFEFGLNVIGGTTLDEMYYSDDKVHAFIRKRVGKPLEPADFESLSQWAYVAIGTKHMRIPEKKRDTTT
jgi:hypothetical protein